MFINPSTPGNRKITRNTDCASESKGNYLLQPFDFLSLSGAFGADTQIHFIDAVADRLSDSACFERIALLKFRLVIVAIVDLTWTRDYQFISELRNKYPEMAILAFGDALIEDESAKKLNSIVDGIVVSPFLFKPGKVDCWTREAFQRVDRAACGLRTETSYSGTCKKPVLCDLGPPRHELFKHVRYRWPFSRYKKYTTVTATWGCPYSCSYCTSSRLPPLYRDHTSIVEELRMIKALGIREIYFGDKSFGIPVENTTKLLEGMIREKMSFSWSTYLHPRQATPAFLRLMKEAGCHTIITGIETSAPGRLQRFGRSIGEGQIEKVLQAAKEAGLQVCGDFLLGLPGENEDDILATIDYSLRLALDYASFNIVAPLPGSSIKALAVSEGRMRADDHHFDSVGGSNVLGSALVSAERLQRLRNQAVVGFYLRPGYLLRRVLGVRGWEHFQLQLAEAFELLFKVLKPKRRSV
ncbi:MAG: hypothetical protein A2Z97_06910 [Bdellovibrionales bacterium GWB1_52_6]|nr:MAG: hypothetical protein A2Z97_06910 [Bdellovibrionales bacterium GWB1_52_6]